MAAPIAKLERLSYDADANTIEAVALTSDGIRIAALGITEDHPLYERAWDILPNIANRNETRKEMSREFDFCHHCIVEQFLPQENVSADIKWIVADTGHINDSRDAEGVAKAFGDEYVQVALLYHYQMQEKPVITADQLMKLLDSIKADIPEVVYDLKKTISDDKPFSVYEKVQLKDSFVEKIYEDFVKLEYLFHTSHYEQEFVFSDYPEYSLLLQQDVDDISRMHCTGTILHNDVPVASAGESFFMTGQWNAEADGIRFTMDVEGAEREHEKVRDPEPHKAKPSAREVDR